MENSFGRTVDSSLESVPTDSGINSTGPRNYIREGIIRSGQIVSSSVNLRGQGTDRRDGTSTKGVGGLSSDESPFYKPLRSRLRAILQLPHSGSASHGASGGVRSDNSGTSLTTPSGRTGSYSSTDAVNLKSTVAFAPSSSGTQDSTPVYPPTTEFRQSRDKSNIDRRYDDMTIKVPDQPAHNFANLSSEKLLHEQAVKESMQQMKDGNVTNTPLPKLQPCPICQVDYALDDDVMILKCRHDFHTDCIKKWAFMKCPVCGTP